jgi:hypothetical protein
MADGRFDVVRAAAKVYTAVTLVVVAFQLALAAGAPLGQFAMGGASEGAYPPVMRTFAVMQAGLLLLMAGVVLARAGVALPRWSEETRWLTSSRPAPANGASGRPSLSSRSRAASWWPCARDARRMNRGE